MVALSNQLTKVKCRPADWNGLFDVDALSSRTAEKIA